MPGLTETLLNLPHTPDTFSIDSNDKKQLESCTVLMWSKTCSAASVDEARQQLFSHDLLTLEAPPPTKAALYQQVYLTSQSRGGSEAVGVVCLMPVLHVISFYIVAAKSMSRQLQVCEGRLIPHIAMHVL